METHGWLTGQQMIDGLALGETTPGPLIMVVAFVGGWTKELAVFIASHVLWPQASESDPFGGPFEWFSLLITIAAFITLWRYKTGIIQVIGASALAGLAYSLIV